MKKSVVFILLVLAFAPVLQAGTWTGWITDSECNAKGAKADHKACTLKCHAEGATLVFYNNADKKIYKLDDQKLAKAHVGSEVVVTGDVTEDAIKVASIEDKK
jgi:hypothetical protein